MVRQNFKNIYKSLERFYTDPKLIVEKFRGKIVKQFRLILSKRPHEMRSSSRYVIFFLLKFRKPFSSD